MGLFLAVYAWKSPIFLYTLCKPDNFYFPDFTSYKNIAFSIYKMHKNKDEKDTKYKNSLGVTCVIAVKLTGVYDKATESKKK
ncbi:hypothetical protein DW841_00420 [Hungatella hathewayi]|nr:hypothetical protein DW841_00420 [Hungatella hathewayi]